ncbi:hypothetical protein ABW21_db0200636 [Orbilia brochopaga]|nr:hypothetical protein ABW21_db0200636 [Drechslerella brochopaga]
MVIISAACTASRTFAHWPLRRITSLLGCFEPATTSHKGHRVRDRVGDAFGDMLLEKIRFDTTTRCGRRSARRDHQDGRGLDLAGNLFRAEDGIAEIRAPATSLAWACCWRA